MPQDRPGERRISARAAAIGAAALKRRIKSTPVESPDQVHPFPPRSHESAKDLAARLQFLLDRRDRGERLWGDRAIAECISECEAEWAQAEEQEGRRRHPSEPGHLGPRG